MLEELHTASSLLCAALERYFNACSALHSGHSYRHSINNNTPELLGSMAKELRLVESYKGKLLQAKAAVKRARNGLANVPVNSLPPEVLTRIFHLVLAGQPCPLRVSNYWTEFTIPFPKYPDTLSHVCSQWRQVALASPSLWSHIDIALSCPLSKRFHNRAAVYAARARQVPLDIHLVDPGYFRQAERSQEYEGGWGYDSSESVIDSDDEWDKWNTLVDKNNPKKFTFLVHSLKPQIRSLGLLVCYQNHPIHTMALEHCLISCLPGGLSKLVVNTPNKGSGFFITTPGVRWDYASDHQLFISEQQLEGALGPTRALELKGKYIRWTSAAYHGLTDLRLLGRNEISVLELGSVLRSSPELRVFRCDFNINDSTHQGAPIAPVSLQELQTLDLAMGKESVERLIRWLDPGSEPLRFSLALFGDSTPTGLEEFFTRSNVQEMRITFKEPKKSQGSPLPMPPLPPRLRTLVLVGWDRSSSAAYGFREVPVPLNISKNDLPAAEVGTLCLLEFPYSSFPQFQAMVRVYSPQRLVLWKCGIYQRSSLPTRIDLPLLKSKLGRELSHFCPHIECLTDWGSNPLQDWD